MQTKYRIWGSVMFAPLAISKTLASLNVSHTIRSGSRLMRVNKGYEQPLAVHVTESLTDYREGTVNFIVSSAAALASTNYPVLKGDIDKCVKAALLSRTLIVPEIRVISYMDYVDQVAKPSFLNKIQTQIYKIQPYKLRKEIQQLVLAYLASKVPKKKIKTVLADNLKLEELLRLIVSEEAGNLRAAVARTNSEGADAVSSDTGFPTFELLYLSKERK